MEVIPVTFGVGNGFTVVVFDVEPVHPFTLVTVTVKLPAVLTLIVCVLAPLDHE